MSFAWTAYAGLIYKFNNPSSEYINYIDNYIIFYNVLATIALIIVSFFLSVLIFANHNIENSKNVDITVKEVTTINKCVEEFIKSKVRMFLHSLTTFGFGIFGFVFMSEYYFGFLQLGSIIFVKVLVFQLLKLVEKINKVLEKKNQ